ncbi:MAG: hypothetical protein SGPRY_011905, partial [Prymnesium sp.]
TPFILSVAGGNHSASFSLVARSTSQLLQDGVPYEAQLLPNDMASFIIRVPDDADRPVLLVSSLQGHISLVFRNPGHATERVMADPDHPATVLLHPGLNNITALEPETPPPRTHGENMTHQCVPPSMLVLPSLDEHPVACAGLIQLGISGCEEYYKPMPEIGGWQPCVRRAGECTPGIAVQCGGFLVGMHKFVLLPIISSSTLPTLVEGRQLSLALPPDVEQQFRLVVSAKQAITLTAEQRNGASATITLSALIGAGGLLPVQSGDKMVQHALPGEAAQIVLSDALAHHGCNPECLVLVGLSVSSAANISLIADFPTAVTELPLSRTYCVSVDRGALKQFAVLLNPDQPATDDLLLELQQCHGDSEAHAGFLAPPGPLSREFSSRGSLDSLKLTPAELDGRSTVYAAVKGKSEAPFRFCLSARPASQVAKRTSLPHSQGQLEWASEAERRLELSLVPMKTSRPYIRYDVYFAPKQEGTLLHTWCAVEASGRLLYTVERASSSTSSTPRISISVPLPPAGTLPAECIAPPSTATRTAREHCFAVELGESYLLTVVAVEATDDRKHVYAPIEWVPGARSGGASGFVVFCVVVFILGLLAALVYGLVAAKRRGLEPEDVADYVRDGYHVMVGRARGLRLMERVSGISSHWSRRSTSSNHSESARAREGNSMCSPLTCDTNRFTQFDSEHIPVIRGATGGVSSQQLCGSPEFLDRPLQIEQMAPSHAAMAAESVSTTRPAISEVNALPLVMATPVSASEHSDGVSRGPPLPLPSKIHTYDMDE